MGRKGLLAIVLLSLFIAFILKFSGSLRTMNTFTCQWKNLSYRL